MDIFYVPSIYYCEIMNKIGYEAIGCIYDGCSLVLRNCEKDRVIGKSITFVSRQFKSINVEPEFIDIIPYGHYYNVGRLTTMDINQFLKIKLKYDENS